MSYLTTGNGSIKKQNKRKAKKVAKRMGMAGSGKGRWHFDD